MKDYYHILMILMLCGLLLAMIFALIRAIRGPRRADRILGVNMGTSISMATIAILAVYAALVAALLFARRTASAEPRAENAENEASRTPTAFDQIAWLAIPAVSCALLTSTTTFVCSDVSPLPLLWVVFLAIFLLSYAVGFNVWAEKALPVLVVMAAFALFPLASFVQDAGAEKA